MLARARSGARKREQALQVELELLRARVKTEESAAANATSALVAGARATAGRVRRAGPRQPEEQQRGVPAAGARAAGAPAAGRGRRAQGARDRDRIAWCSRSARRSPSTEAQIQSIERERIDAFATIKSQMEMLASGQNLLSRETRNLVTALRRPDVRGRWGEITLKRLVELSGMSAHVDFTEQHHQLTDDGRRSDPT